MLSMETELMSKEKDPKMVYEVTAQENEYDETEETADIEPLLKFLDETDLHERLNILLQLSLIHIFMSICHSLRTM